MIRALFLGLASLWAPAVPEAPPGRLIELAPHAWAWISSDDRSANGAVFAGDSAALVVDPGLTPGIARRFLAAVATVTDRPVRYALVTHWHPDHALGVTCLADRPFPVFATPEARAALAQRAATVVRGLASSARDDAERRALAQCRVAPPDSIVAEGRRFDLGGLVVEAFAPGPAHTDGDLVVWDPAERVLVTGDVMMHRAAPDMDEGHPSHWLEVLNALISLGPRAVVAGHFGPSTPADLVRFRDYLAALIEQVTTAYRRGDPPGGIPAAVRMPAFADFAQYPEFHATVADNAARVLAELRASPGGTR